WDAVWSADRVVTPWKIDTEYPYAEDAAFIVPPDRPFLDSMTCLAYLAGRTERIQLGISVLVLPYRHPLYWARVAASVDLLAGARPATATPGSLTTSGSRPPSSKPGTKKCAGWRVSLGATPTRSRSPPAPRSSSRRSRCSRSRTACGARPSRSWRRSALTSGQA